MPTLTDHQVAHIIELLEAGQDLPLDYKHLLFPPERQEYELTCAGKEPEEDILAKTMAVPLLSIRIFGQTSDVSQTSEHSHHSGRVVIRPLVQILRLGYG